MSSLATFQNVVPERVTINTKYINAPPVRTLGTRLLFYALSGYMERHDVLARVEVPV